MKIDFTTTKPIFIQISEIIENQILEDYILEEEQVFSTNELSKMLNINPATARKGLNILVDEGIIYKKRGMGMYVVTGAKEIIIKKRKDLFYNDYIQKLVKEAEKLKITKTEIIDMIKKEGI